MKTNQTIKSKSKTLRAVGYCRTSGSGQKDNTSIPQQKELIENFADYNNNYKFLKHYVDESKSGSLIAGRIEFQKMLSDAERGQFDIVIVKDMKRFGRDGLDTLLISNRLYKDFGVNVVPVQGSFDIQDRRKILNTFLEAGLSQDEKIQIIDRMQGGKIAKAKAGLRWCPMLPVGRGYERISKTQGRWFINEQGRQLKEILEKYVNGESMRNLAKKYGYPSERSITRIVRQSQLTGVYQAPFTCKELPEYNITIPVKAVPEVIDSKLMKRVQAKLDFNRTWNKQAVYEHLLAGFVFCKHCGRALSLQVQKKKDKSGKIIKERIYFRHNHFTNDKKERCPFDSIHSYKFEKKALDYLYTFFMDEPAYNEAVKRAMPSDDDRQALNEDLYRVEQQLIELSKQEKNFAAGLRAGLKVTKAVIAEQEQMERERNILEVRKDELMQTKSDLPDEAKTQLEIEYLRLNLIYEYGDQDWQELSYKQIRGFLHHLFSDNPKRNGYGIFIELVGKTKLYGKKKFDISFNGCVEFASNDVLRERHFAQVDKCLDRITKLEKKMGIYNLVTDYQ